MGASQTLPLGRECVGGKFLLPNDSDGMEILHTYMQTQTNEIDPSARRRPEPGEYEEHLGYLEVTYEELMEELPNTMFVQNVAKFRAPFAYDLPFAHGKIGSRNQLRLVREEEEEGKEESRGRRKKKKKKKKKGSYGSIELVRLNDAVDLMLKRGVAERRFEKEWQARMINEGITHALLTCPPVTAFINDYANRMNVTVTPPEKPRSYFIELAFVLKATGLPETKRGENEVAIVLERAHFTMGQLITREKDEEVLLDCILQVVQALGVLQKAIFFTHNDLHRGNVMFIRRRKTIEVTRSFGNYKIRCPRSKYRMVLIDLGESCADLRECPECDLPTILRTHRKSTRGGTFCHNKHADLVTFAISCMGGFKNKLTEHAYHNTVLQTVIDNVLSKAISVIPKKFRNLGWRYFGRHPDALTSEFNPELEREWRPFGVWYQMHEYITKFRDEQESQPFVMYSEEEQEEKEEPALMEETEIVEPPAPPEEEKSSSSVQILSRRPPQRSLRPQRRERSLSPQRESDSDVRILSRPPRSRTPFSSPKWEPEPSAVPPENPPGEPPVTPHAPVSVSPLFPRPITPHTPVTPRNPAELRFPPLSDDKEDDFSSLPPLQFPVVRTPETPVSEGEEISYFSGPRRGWRREEES